MAEALVNWKGRGRFHAESAGSSPADRVNPHAIETLREYHTPVARPGPTQHRRVGTGALGLRGHGVRPREGVVPDFPGQPIMAHWGMADPALVAGDDATKRAAFKDAFLLLSRRIDLLLALPVEKLERLALEARVRAIGNG